MMPPARSGSPEIGLVGVGPWGRHILRDLKSLGCTVHAVARSPESVARAKDGGAATIVDHPARLPDGCDGFVIANRTVSHLDAVDDLIGRGKPIFCEKPLGTDLKRIEALPPEAGDLVFVMHKWRYHPGILELARIARSGELGAVRGLRTMRTGWTNTHPDVIPLWTLAPHELSIALAILGEVPEPVMAMPDPMDEAGRAAIAHLRTGDGLPFTFEVSARHPVNLRRVMLSCEGGAAVLDSSDYGSILVQREDGTADRLKIGDDMPLLAELRAFVSFLAGGSAPVTPLAEEIEIVGAIARIEQMIAAS
jgi:predicted dehydrogenase